MEDVAAIVLAAGRGERVGGRAKATLLLPDGRSFIAAVVQAARAARAGPIVVVVAAPHEAVTRAAAEAAGADQVVVNPVPERGMASSFARGLDALEEAAAPTRAALAWPVDHPIVAVVTVATLVAAAASDRIVVPTWGGRGGHPAAFGAGLYQECRAASGAEGGLRTVLRGQPERVLRVEVPDPGVMEDIDTLDDWARLGQNRE